MQISFHQRAIDQVTIFILFQSGVETFPLVALAPILVTGVAKWPQGKASPFDAALNELAGDAAIEVTKRLDFLVGDDLKSICTALIATSTIR